MKCAVLIVFAAALASSNAQQVRPRMRSTGAPAIVVRDYTAHPIRIAAIDELVNGKLGGVNGARMICNEMSYHAMRNSDQRWRSGNWRAVITTRLQSLWSLVVYQHERDNSTILNLKDDNLWPSWNDFVDGNVSNFIVENGKTQIYTFDGKDIIDVFAAENQPERFAWFGYTPDSEFNEVNTINASSEHCGNWMLATGYGPALDLDKFMETGSIASDSIVMKPCASKFALLCVERTADFEGGFTFSMYGKDVGGRQRGKAVHPYARKFKKMRNVSTTKFDRRRRTTARRSN